ncbi:MAG: apolipoprotein N-acyltransferase [Methylophilaceae bacterium]|nr:apolipoprotein N-acyltransferase [Methyloradius sp.]
MQLPFFKSNNSVHSSLPLSCFFSLLLGSISIAGYAPFYLFPITPLALAGLFYLIYKTASPKQASLVTYSFSLGFFCTGVSWIYVSLHDFGGMPFWMAGFATFTFCAFLALFPTVAGWLSKKTSHVLIAAPVLWVLAEWVRSWIFTGFPWINVSYSQVPHSPLAGFAPIVGAYGLSLVTALSASLLLLLLNKNTRKKAALALLVLWVSGGLLKLVPWTQPSGEPISVALLQGNIAQDIKWDAAQVQRTLDQYYSLATQSSAKLIVMPETALPMLINEVPPNYLELLKTHAENNQGDMLIGAVEYENEQYYNSMLSYGSEQTQSYRKFHLVPFGEFIPLKQVFGWIYRDWLNIPLTDLSRGDSHPQPMNIAGQKVAVDICYEDVFGEEIIHQLPSATLLVNASNDAWYGQSLASYQHLQMSQMRAMEAGRMMLRATNTGATAIINRDGSIVSTLPHFTTGTLQGQAQGYIGTTPYVRFGNWPTLIVLFLSVALLWGRKKK